jgi:hypothetical protein
MDPSGRIAWANDAVVAGFGDLLGAELTNVVALMLRRPFRARLDEAVAATAPVPALDTVVVDRHGNQAAVSVTLARLEAGGELMGLLGLLRVPTSGAGEELLQAEVLALLGRPDTVG